MKQAVNSNGVAEKKPTAPPRETPLNAPSAVESPQPLAAGSDTPPAKGWTTRYIDSRMKQFGTR